MFHLEPSLRIAYLFEREAMKSTSLPVVSRRLKYRELFTPESFVGTGYTLIALVNKGNTDSGIRFLIVDGYSLATL